jgi:FlaA1/EpsC-like NDP-sugar epimerase
VTLSETVTRVRAAGHLWVLPLLILDSAVVLVATVMAYYSRFEGRIPPAFARWIMPLVGLALVVYLLLFWAFGLYRLVLRHVGLDTLIKLSGATVIGFAILLGVNFAFPVVNDLRPVPIGVLFTQAILVFLGASSVRLTARVLLYVRSSRPGAGRRVLIIGAGSAGSLLLREIRNRPDLGLSVMGFLDDDTALKSRTISGVRVLGPTSALEKMVVKHDIAEILVAMPAAPKETMRRILNAAADAGVETRIMPELVIARGSVHLRDLRNVDVEDLLGREPTGIDVEQIRGTIAGRVVAVTGAAGSIGSELCRQIVALDPLKLVLIEIDETRLYELFLELETVAPGIAISCICDIRDVARLDEVMAEYRPSVVLHAAAYKHVPMMELAPEEAVKTNVLGTLNVIQACERYAAERFVLISTDKAVAPANVMGLTKSLAERAMLVASQRGAILAVAVRFGNVLASRGSVVPIFENQLRHGGPLSVTDPEVTRYFMTIPEAARLVLQAQAIGETGDIFVLEMGEPVKIVDLARKMIALSGVPADIEFVGLRPGEKLHESLTHVHETLRPTSRDKILRVDVGVTSENPYDDAIRELDKLAARHDTKMLGDAVGRLEQRVVEHDDPLAPL